jgi:hypothetical protein
MIMGTQIRPSEMQGHLLQAVVPITLIAIQSIAEDALEDASGTPLKAYRRIESLVDGGRIDRALASSGSPLAACSHIIAHAGGTIDRQTEVEAANLLAQGPVFIR